MPDKFKLHIKNQSIFRIEFCCGEKEYELEPDRQVTIEAEDEDCMYFDQVSIVGAE
jgi:hypothetical protein